MSTVRFGIDWGQPTPPPNYRPGISRNERGFVTNSDLSNAVEPARKASAAEKEAEGARDAMEDAIAKVKAGRKDKQLNAARRTAAEEEAEAAKNKMHRSEELLGTFQAEAAATKEMTLEDWESLHMVGDRTLKYKEEEAKKEAARMVAQPQQAVLRSGALTDALKDAGAGAGDGEDDAVLAGGEATVPSGSKELLQERLRRDDKDASAYVALARIYADEGHRRAAFKCLRDGCRRIRQDPELWHEALRLANGQAEVREVVGEAVEACGSLNLSARDIQRDAMARRRAGAIERLWLAHVGANPLGPQRLDAAREAVIGAPWSKALWDVLLEEEGGDPAAVRSILKAAVKASPHLPGLWLRFSRCEVDVENAKALVTMGLQKNPGSSDLWLEAIALDIRAAATDGTTTELVARAVAALQQAHESVDSVAWMQAAADLVQPFGGALDAAALRGLAAVTAWLRAAFHIEETMATSTGRASVAFTMATAVRRIAPGAAKSAAPMNALALDHESSTDAEIVATQQLPRLLLVACLRAVAVGDAEEDGPLVTCAARGLLNQLSADVAALVAQLPLGAGTAVVRSLVALGYSEMPALCTELRNSALTAALNPPSAPVGGVLPSLRDGFHAAWTLARETDTAGAFALTSALVTRDPVQTARTHPYAFALHAQLAATQLDQAAQRALAAQWTADGAAGRGPAWRHPSILIALAASVVAGPVCGNIGEATSLLDRGLQIYSKTPVGSGTSSSSGGDASYEALAAIQFAKLRLLQRIESPAQVGRAAEVGAQMLQKRMAKAGVAHVCAAHAAIVALVIDVEPPQTRPRVAKAVVDENIAGSEPIVRAAVARVYAAAGRKDRAIDRLRGCFAMLVQRDELLAQAPHILAQLAEFDHPGDAPDVVAFKRAALATSHRQQHFWALMDPVRGAAASIFPQSCHDAVVV